MDEVEAALDDVNLQRFLGLVHEFRDGAQLIIVSHQKRTMEAADALYGVTMAPGGSSKVVSQKVARGGGGGSDGSGGSGGSDGEIGDPGRATDELVAEEPAASEPAIEEPVAEEPATEEPATEELADQLPRDREAVDLSDIETATSEPQSGAWLRPPRVSRVEPVGGTDP
jgi:hypothetical protein